MKLAEEEFAGANIDMEIAIGFKFDIFLVFSFRLLFLSLSLFGCIKKR